MESHEVLREAFDKVSPKQVAADLGVSLSLVYKWAQPPSGDARETGSGSRNPLDRVEDLMRLSQHQPIIEWLCRAAGGYFVKNPRSSCRAGFEVVPATHELVQQFADLLSEISQAAQDNSITLEEARGIRGCWDDLKSLAEGFVRCCEEGDFARLHPHGLPVREPGAK